MHWDSPAHYYPYPMPKCFRALDYLTGPVWKVARYTCAAPVLFGESDDYVDGGLLANNPSDSALSRIQAFHRSHNEKFPLSLVVSVGCGKYPFQRLGNVDFLFVGSQWSSLSGTSNLMALLSYAVSTVPVLFMFEPLLYQGVGWVGTWGLILQSTIQNCGFRESCK